MRAQLKLKVAAGEDTLRTHPRVRLKAAATTAQSVLHSRGFRPVLPLPPQAARYHWWRRERRG